MLAYGRGVPSVWVEDVVAAEAWAFQVIMSLSPTSPSVVTDCLNIVHTMKRGMAAALAEKSPLARVWQLVFRANDSAGFTDDQLRDLVWMPAHGSLASVGKATMSDGSKVGMLQWRANRLVDLLAKSAARPLRIHKKTRDLLRDASEALEFSLGMLGAVTFAANNHRVCIQASDGTARTVTLRDSAGAKVLRRSGGRRREKRKAEHALMSPDCADAAVGQCTGVCVQISCSFPACPADGPASQRRRAKRRRTAADHETECELRFRTLWGAGLAALRPAGGRSASTRMAELRERVAARAAADRAHSAF